MVNSLVWKASLRAPWRGWWMAALLFLPVAGWAAPNFQTSLDRDSINLGETATLSLIFTDCPDVGQPQLPPIDGIEYGATSMSTETTFVNGVSTGKTTFTQEIRPAHTGRFVIPALSVNISGMTLSSQPLVLNVGRSRASSPGSGPAFVRLVPETNTIYFGETIPVNVVCYYQNNIDYRYRPQFSSDGFTISEMPGNPSQSRQQVGNNVYGTLNFRVAMTPTRTGRFALGPATWTVGVSSGPPTFFGFFNTRQQTFTSDSPEINVLPVPSAQAPATFHGAIGSFVLAQYEAGPTAVGVGDPITVKIRIQGQGSFDSVRLPANEPGWRDFNTYPPTSKFDSGDPLKIQGSKYFEQVVTPLNADVKQIPPFVFTFFDPESGTFRSLTHGPIPLQVHPTAATPQPTVIASGAAPPDAQQQTSDIVHIKPFLGTVSKPGPPLIEQPWFLGLQVIPPLAWAGALIWRRRKEALANNPRLRRRRAVERLVRTGLAELERLARGNEVDQFYSTVLRLLQEQLGERLDLPAPAITAAVAEEWKGLDEAARGRLRELFQACDQYRYTPEHTAQELASLIPKLQQTLADLQRSPAAAGRVSAAVMALLVFGLALSARAEPVEDTFTRANKLYEEGKYRQAAAIYEGILKEGNISAAVYFNEGNAWFKAGQAGRAISDYRRAENLAPRDPDIRANLQIARAQVSATRAVPGSRWTRWVSRATLNEWTIAAACCAGLFFLMLAARQIWPALARSGAGATWGLGLASMWLLVSLGLSASQHLSDKSAVVTASEAVMREGPMEEAQSTYTLHDGAELLVLARDGEWLQVEDGSKHVGWVQEKQVAEL